MMKIEISDFQDTVVNGESKATQHMVTLEEREARYNPLVLTYKYTFLPLLWKWTFTVEIVFFCNLALIDSVNNGQRRNPVLYVAHEGRFGFLVCYASSAESSRAHSSLSVNPQLLQSIAPGAQLLSSPPLSFNSFPWHTRWISSPGTSLHSGNIGRSSLKGSGSYSWERKKGPPPASSQPKGGRSLHPLCHYSYFLYYFYQDLIATILL